MAPIKRYSDWNRRSSDESEQIEPYRKYFFICEGANTETWYFKCLVDNKKQLGIHSTVDICFIEKTEQDRDISYPRKLIEFAEEQKKNEELSFDEDTDVMVIIFDTDIFENKVSDYDAVLELGEKHNLLGISNPSFELFLLLHYPNAFEMYIKPNETAIIKNEEVGKRRYIRTLFTDVSGMNPKSNSAVGELALNIDVAIMEEAKINEDIHNAKGHVTCNIAKIIDDIRKNRHF